MDAIQTCQAAFTQIDSVKMDLSILRHDPLNIEVCTAQEQLADHSAKFSDLEDHLKCNNL